MNGTEAIQNSVRRQTVTCDVLRLEDTGSYSESRLQVDTVDVAVFSPSSQAEMVPAGIDADASLMACEVPQTDAQGNLIQTTEIGDYLRPQSNTALRYVVKTKDAHPNELDPDLWLYGLDRANG